MFTAEKLDGLQAELNAAAESCYADEGERAMVKTIIIPELRVRMGQLLDKVQLPLTPRKADKLCASIDAALQEKNKLLDVDGLLKPLMPAIVELRKQTRTEIDEDFLAACRTILAQHGVTDRKTLLKKGVEWFRNTEFLPYGKGKAFASLILKRSSLRVSLEILDEIADVLGFTKPDRAEELKIYKDALAAHGVRDRQTFIEKGSGWFEKRANFPPFGKGKSIARPILGRPVEGITRDILHEIADELGFPRLSEKEILDEYRSLFALRGVVDRMSFLQKGPKWFIEAEFPPYGKGAAFAGRILGRSNLRPTIETLNEISDVLGFPKISLTDYRAALKAYGITDRESLIKKGVEFFRGAEFPPFGGGVKFANFILGRSGICVTVAVLEEIADALEFPKPSEAEVLNKCREALVEHKIIDRDSLITKGPEWFMRTKFSTFGGGVALAACILNRRVFYITIDVMHEIADVLGFSKRPTEAEQRNKYLAALKVHGIIDRDSLIAKGSGWFSRTEFPPFRKGSSFAGDILQTYIVNVSHQVLHQIADKLGW